MHPTEVLSQEHRAIELALDVFERLAAEARQTGMVDRGVAQQTLEFLTEFADRMHHGKEEQVLFPRMEAHGFPGSHGPIAVMLNEHDCGRGALSKIRALLSGTEFTDEQVRRFAATAAEYVELLREHIAKEDGVLFPLGESLLTAEERTAMLARFAQVEVEILGRGGREARMRAIEQLAARVGVPIGDAREAGPRRYSCGARPH